MESETISLSALRILAKEVAVEWGADPSGLEQSKTFRELLSDLYYLANREGARDALVDF